MTRPSMMAFLLLAVVSNGAQAGWPFFADDGLVKGTPEWYEAHAADPPGTRQRYKFGKLWPPFPRPAGPHQPCIHKYYAAHYWPYPYNCQDRAAVHAFADTQMLNGWLMATTLFDYHFDPLTQELNSAGQQHLRWIVSHAPDAYREAHVAVAEKQDVTSARLVNVEREVARLVGTGPAIPVLPRAADPVGRPASEVDSIFEKAAGAMPDPVIQYTANGESNSE